MHSIVTTFRGAVIKVEVANFCAAMDTLIDQDDILGEKLPSVFNCSGRACLLLLLLLLLVLLVNKEPQGIHKYLFRL